MRGVYFLLRFLIEFAGAYTWFVGGGAVAIMTTAYWLSSEYPFFAAIAVVLGGLLLVAVIVGAVFVPRAGQCWPPWWAWFRAPLRKVAWRFGCVLDVHNLPSKGFVVAQFAASLKVNRGRITPKRFFLESATGRTIWLSIQRGPRYLRPEQIEYIPAGEWLHFSGRILKDQHASDDGRTNHPSREEFFQLYDDLTLVFAYDDYEFRKRFARSSLRRIIDAGIAALSPDPARLPVARDIETAERAQQTVSERVAYVDPKPMLMQTRQLSTYEAGHKAEILDALISLVRGQLRQLARDAEGYSSHGTLAFRQRSRLDEFEKITAELLQGSNLLWKEARAMLKDAEVYADISAAAESFPVGQRIDLAIGSYNQTFTDLILWSKNEAPREVFQRLIGPREIAVRESASRLAKWLNKAEQNLVQLRRKL